MANKKDNLTDLVETLKKPEVSSGNSSSGQQVTGNSGTVVRLNY